MKLEGVILRWLVPLLFVAAWSVVSSAAACIVSTCWAWSDLDRWALALGGVLVGGRLLSRGSPRLAAIAALVGAAYAEGIMARHGAPSWVIGPMVFPAMWAIAALQPRILARPLLVAACLVAGGVAAAPVVPVVLGATAEPFSWAAAAPGGLLSVICVGVGMRSPRYLLAALAIGPVVLHLALHAVPGYAEATAGLVRYALNAWLLGGLVGLLFTPPDPDLPRLVFTGEDNDQRRDPAGSLFDDQRGSRRSRALARS
jgi:hypothetical protein